MTLIEMMVLAGILMLISAFNLKLAIWYIERKQAKKALESYNGALVSEETMQIQLPPVSFSLSEIKCADAIEKNIDSYLDALSSNEIEKIGIMKEDTLVAVIIPIERYEKLIEYASHVQLPMTYLETRSNNVSL
ncbi:hypothetical protein SUSP_002609 [Sulfurospirillum sp. 'SP']|nr:hypothetical protein [Sulfurospirillum sp. 'SP']WNZ00192.1 hypothetical protein SUSP_002609 [Sulfurospirillum sp. 'SP']